MRRSVIVVAIAIVVAAACSGTPSEHAPTTGGSAPPGTSTPDVPSTSPEPVDVPATSAGRQLQWLVAAINDDESARAQVGDRFTTAMLAEVPEPMLQEVLAQFGAAGPVVITRYDGDEYRASAVLSTGDADERMSVDLAVEPEPPHRIEGLFFAPAEAEATEASLPTTLEELTAMLRDIAPRSALLVADEECALSSGHGVDELHPIASVAKLYVAIAVVEAIAAGELTWSSPIPVRSEAISLPPGRTRYDEAGTTLTVEELLRRSMQESDNTATDLLIDAVGREAVEEAMITGGHHNPELNQPFLTTRELALLKLSGDEARVSSYLQADVAGRRALLAELQDVPIGRVEDLDLSESPVAIDQLEWFATAADICRAWTTLLSGGASDRPLASVVGSVEESGVWNYVAFKDGYEPGVSALSWYLVDRDGQVVIAVVLAADADEPLPAHAPRSLAAATLEVLERRGRAVADQ